MICSKMQPFWVKPHSCLILWQSGVFSFTKVCIFLPMVFIMVFITTVCFYDFCKTVLVKNTHLAKVWFDFPLQMPDFFTLAFKWYFTYTIEAPLSLRTSCKKSRGRCPQAPTRAYKPWTLRTHVLKNNLPANLCWLCVIPKSIMNLHRLFNVSYINTHFDMFFKN